DGQVMRSQFPSCRWRLPSVQVAAPGAIEQQAFECGSPFNNNGSRRQCDPQGDRDPQRQQYTPASKVNWYTLPQAVGTEEDVCMRGPESHVSPRQQYCQNSHLPCRDCRHASHVEQHRRLKEVCEVARCLRSFFRLDFSLINSEEAAAKLTFFDGSRSALEQCAEHASGQHYHCKHG